MGEKLGGFIRKLRADKKWTLREASKHIGIAESYLWQLENDRRGIAGPDMFKKLAEGYGVPAETLLKHAGYAVGPVDEKQESDAKKKTLYRDYDKLPDEGKKELDNLMGWLQQKYSKK